MNNLCDEIKTSIERQEDEYPVFAVLAYGIERAIVIWADPEFSRTEFAMDEHQLPFADNWNYSRELHYTTGGGCVECVHIDGDVDQYSLDDEIERLSALCEDY